MMIYLIENSVLERPPHHQSIKALWETKWRKRVSVFFVECCQRAKDQSQVVPQIYPFWEGKLEDFKDIFHQLIEVRSPN